MDYQVKPSNKWEEFISNKKVFYPIVLIILIFLVIAAVLFIRADARRKAEQAAEAEKQKAAQVLEEKRRNATYSRFSFFLASPVGERGAMNMPSYQEGGWRIPDTLNKSKKMTILYVKNPNYETPLMYVRYGDRKNFKLEAGEEELKTDSKNLIYVYYFYPTDSYQGPDKDEFIMMQKDFEEALKTFSIF